MKFRHLFVFLAISACTQHKVVSLRDVEKMAVDQLAQVQSRSIQEEREYCGWIWMREDAVEASQVKAGSVDGCDMVIPPFDAVVLASFHTHGSHDPIYLSELPSVLDVQGDYADETIGYVATPGGRVWRVDPFSGTIGLICGRNCLESDPNYRASEVPPLKSVFTLEEFMLYSEYYAQ